MSSKIRKKSILEHVYSYDEVTVQDLSMMFNVSEMTIRRDLIKLEDEGFIRRTYGGAIAINRNLETPVQIRSAENLDKKKAIAAACAHLVQAKDTLLMDAGTTVMEVARQLPEDLDLTVITNAITVVNALIDRPDIKLIVLGGPVEHVPQVTVGSSVIETIKYLNVNRAFITATGFSIEHGLTDANILQSEIKKLMMSRAQIKTLVIDSSKYGTTSLHRFSDIQEFDQVVTDNKLDPAIVERLQSFPTEVILAPISSPIGFK
jgi:DeoR/GlpR family transcriptional regulator of sugar metabolism